MSKAMRKVIKKAVKQALEEMGIDAIRDGDFSSGEPTKDSIDWSHVSDKYNYMARDCWENAYLFDEEPYIDGRCFVPFSGFGAYAAHFASYKRGTCDWQDSLVVRPGYEEES